MKTALVTTALMLAWNIAAFGEVRVCCDYPGGSIVVKEIAETCVSMLFSPDRHSIPSLVCLPVRYQYGGTTRDQNAAEDN